MALSTGVVSVTVAGVISAILLPGLSEWGIIVFADICSDMIVKNNTNDAILFMSEQVLHKFTQIIRNNRMKRKMT